MRNAVVIVSLAITLGVPASAAAQRDEDTTAQFWLLTWPSAISTPLARMRTRLFHHALRYVFAHNGTTWASRSTDCARHHDATPRMLAEAEHCGRAPDPWAEMRVWDQPPPDPAESPREDIMVMLYAGDRPTLDPRHDDWDDIVAIDVSETSSPALGLAACELAARQRDITCERRDAPAPVEHPDDDLLIVEESDDGSYGARKVTWQGWHDRRLFRGPTENVPFLIQAHVDWEMPEGSLDVAVANDAGYPSEASTSIDPALARLVRQRLLRLVATLDGEPIARPEMHPPYDEDPVAVTVPLPRVDPGDHRIEVRIESSHPDDAPIVGALRWRHAEHDAGRFHACFATEAVPRDRDGLLYAERSGEWCVAAPWWSGGVDFLRIDDEAGGVVTGSVRADPTFASFVAVVFLLVLMVRAVITRPPSPTHVAFRVGTRASYREAPVTAWRVSAALEPPAESRLRVVSTPFGTFGLSRSRLWTRRGDELLAARRFIVLQPGTLVVEDEVQLLFLAEEDARDLDEDVLERALTSREEMKLAPAEAGLAAHISSNERLARVAAHVGIAFVVTTLAMGTAYYAGLSEPLLSQIAPFIGITLITAVVLHVAFHHLVIRRHPGPRPPRRDHRP